MCVCGEKVRLRAITRNDTSNILKWRNQDWVKNNFIYQEDFTKETHEKWLCNMVDTGKVVQFIIEDINEGRSIGSVYLRDIDYENEKAEFGIFIGEQAYIGKGIGQEAAGLIIKYGFEKLKLHKIYLRVLAENSIAIKSYLKVGFVQEAYFKDEIKIRGKYRDIIIMSILNLIRG